MFMEDWGAMHVASNNVDSVTMMATLPVPSRPGLPQLGPLVSPPPLPASPHHQVRAAAEARATLTVGVGIHHLILMGVWDVPRVAFRPADSVDTSTGQPVCNYNPKCVVWQ